MNSKTKTTKKHNQKQTRAIRAPRLFNAVYADTFPRAMKVTLSYFDYFTVTLDGVTSPDYRFRLNSIFDPDLSGVGHQPLGHDQYAAMYNQYRVDYCTVEVTYVTATADTGINAAMFASNDAAAQGDMAVANESPLSKTGCYSPGSKPLKLVRRYDLAYLNGVTRKQYEADDVHWAKMGANPGETATVHSMKTSLSGASTISFTVKLKYEVTLSDVIINTRSLSVCPTVVKGVPTITTPPPPTPVALMRKF